MVSRMSCSLMAWSKGLSMQNEGEWLTSSSQGRSSSSSMTSYLQQQLSNQVEAAAGSSDRECMGHWQHWNRANAGI
eukprot:scaffold243329_cov23-Tisochrysis_lutea.AAC.1